MFGILILAFIGHLDFDICNSYPIAYRCMGQEEGVKKKVNREKWKRRLLIMDI